MVKKGEEKKEIKKEMSKDDKPEATTDPVVVRLKELNVDDEMIEKIKLVLGVDSIEALSALTEGFLTRPDVGMKPVKALMLIKALAPAKPAYDAVSESAAASAFNAASFDAILPIVPTDDSWLAALKAGGVLKIDQSTVISAIRATLARKVGLFDIPNILVAKMEEFADSNEEQVDLEFFKLRKQVTRKSYSEIFGAIDGLEGTFVTEARKKQLFARIDNNLWETILSFNVQLRQWYKLWMDGISNPMVMMNMFMSGAAGVGTMSSGMMQTPDTGVLRDSADAVTNAVNKVFAGTGVQIVSALAYDASNIKETLLNPKLPGLIGAVNRDQMLKLLGVAVPATYPRMEQNLTRFVLSILQVKDQPTGGKEEQQFFGALYMLGSQIQWDQLDSRVLAKKITGIGAGKDEKKIW